MDGARRRAPEVLHNRQPVLVVDDEPDILEIVRLDFARHFDLHTAGTGSEALAILDRVPIAALVTDQRMPGMSGLELIRLARARWPDVMCIMLTGHTDPATMAEAINLGMVHRYVSKPFPPRDLRDVIRAALDTRELLARNERLSTENFRLVEELRAANERLDVENRYLKAEVAPHTGFPAIVGASEAIAHVVEQARRVLESPTTVLIEGPTGSGKELVARALHDESPRRDKLFVAVNCGSMSEELLASALFGHRKGSFTGAVTDQKGFFELADGGTLFLDEVGEMSASMQVHLLRALQEREVLPLGARQPVRVDVRVIAASNRDLRAEVQDGRFRRDLLHRLRVFPIRLPSLAERREDIPLLADHLLARLNAKIGRPVAGFSPEAMAALTAHDYEGNVRELANLIERALIMCPPGEPISEDDLFERIPAGPLAAPPLGAETLREAVSAFERQRILDTIAACGGNKSAAARRLGLTYRGLLMKMQRYGMMPLASRETG
jgi:two-component system response regulator HupR/HoxA